MKIGLVPIQELSVSRDEIDRSVGPYIEIQMEAPKSRLFTVFACM